jgi:hypothetical protein
LPARLSLLHYHHADDVSVSFTIQDLRATTVVTSHFDLLEPLDSAPGIFHIVSRLKRRACALRNISCCSRNVLTACYVQPHSPRTISLLERPTRYLIYPTSAHLRSCRARVARLNFAPSFVDTLPEHSNVSTMFVLCATWQAPSGHRSLSHSPSHITYAATPSSQARAHRTYRTYILCLDSERSLGLNPVYRTFVPFINASST